MVYNCVTNLPEEYHRNWTIATSGQWSKPTPTLTQETKWEHVEVKRRDGGREGFHTNHLTTSARATCFTYETHLSPFNSHEIVQEEVIAKGGRGRSDVERLQGPLQRIPHYTLVTALEYYPCENTLSPLGGYVRVSRLSYLISSLCVWSLERYGSINVSTYVALVTVEANTRAGLVHETVISLYASFYWNEVGSVASCCLRSIKESN